MIGGLQGEFGDLDIKYLKQNISKSRSESFRRNSVALCKMETWSSVLSEFAFNYGRKWIRRIASV